MEKLLLTPQKALVYIMAVAAMSDAEVSDTELNLLREIIKTLPLFRNSTINLDEIYAECLTFLAEENGLDIILKLVKDALPNELYPTAYALACEIVAADGVALQPELRWLAMLRKALHIDYLQTAAIEWSTKVRYQTLA